MPSPSVDPASIQTRPELAAALTQVRLGANLTVRQLAKKLGVPTSTVGDVMGGRHIPSRTRQQFYVALLGACGISDQAEVEHWVEALDRVRSAQDGRLRRSTAGSGTAPYQGLQPFQPEDSHRFFGRSAVTEEVVAALRRLRLDPTPSHGLLVVIGPSGSGKSSILRAGLVPAIRSGALANDADRWDHVLVTHPGEEGRSIVRGLLDAPPPRGVLVIDQFEELLVTSTDALERRSFLESLSCLDPTRTLVVLGLRADFFASAAEEPVLLAALQHAQVVVGPMNDREVREAVVEPARALGISVEEGLVELLLADLAPRDSDGPAHDPGTLPLLSHALLAMWEQSRGARISTTDYRAVGGLRGAVQQTAEALTASLTPSEQSLARQMFLRMVHVSDDSPLTRRRARREEFRELRVDGLEQQDRDIDRVLDRFVAGRLVTAHADWVEVSHEALLWSWPRLRGWLDEDRDGLRMHRQVTNSARQWLDSGRDPTLLLQGGRLEAAVEWVGRADGGGGLNQLEREFLQTSTSRAQQRQEESRRAATRLRRLVAALAVLLVLTGSLAGYAWRARTSATMSRDQALSRQVAIEAEQLRLVDPGLAAQLALTALRTSPTATARSALLDSSAGDLPTRVVGASGPTTLALSADGRILAVTHADDGSVHLYAPSPDRLQPLAVVPGQGRDTQLFAAALSGDGRLLAAGGTGRTVTLWDLRDPRHPARLSAIGPLSGTVQGLALARDGHELATVGDPAGVRRWDLRDPRRPLSLGALTIATSETLSAVAFSPDGRQLAAGGQTGQIAVWPAGARTGSAASSTARAGQSLVTSVAFSPDGRTLAGASKDGLLRVWRLAPADLSLAHAPLGGFTSQANCLAFSPDGGTLLAGSSDTSARAWDTTTWTPVRTLPHPGPVTAVAVTADGRSVLTAAADGTTRQWSLAAPQIGPTSGTVFQLQHGSSGTHLLAVTTSGPNGAVALWDTADPRRPRPVLSQVPIPPGFGPVAGTSALTRDGTLLAVADRAGQVQLVDLHNPRSPVLVGAPLLGAHPLIEQLAFDRTGRLLAGGDDTGKVTLWDVSNPAHGREVAAPSGPTSMVLDIAFSPGSGLLAAASADKKVYVWDVSSPSRARPIKALGGFTNYAYAVAFSPDGRMLAAGSADHTVRLWSLARPADPVPVGGVLSGPSGYVYRLAFTPDGHSLVAATGDHSVWVWDVSVPEHPRPLATLQGAPGPVQAVDVSADGSLVAASGDDHVVHLWNLDPATVAQKVCASAGTPITRQEWAQYLPGTAYDPPCASR